VQNRIFHFPWPDHHPPPFALLPHVLASMRDWLWESSGTGAGHTRKRRRGADGAEHVVVVHCKAGKGRSGTAACSYLIAEEGWTREDALRRFTARRMRPGWGDGISIPSQLRWLAYVERWAARPARVYVERRVEVLEVRIWGLRDGVRVNVDGFVREGKTIRTWHTFAADERTVVRGAIKTTGLADAAVELFGELNGSRSASRNSSRSNLAKPNRSNGSGDAGSGSPHDTGKSTPVEKSAVPLADPTESTDHLATGEPLGADAIFRPKTPIILETNDICIDLERRTKGAYTWAVPTSVAHVWFNSFFEGDAHSGADAADEGVFEIAWDAMDGLKGSSRKGTRACDRLAVAWRARDRTAVVPEPRAGEPVRQMAPADWRGAVAGDGDEDDEEDEGTQAFGVESPAATD